MKKPKWSPPILGWQYPLIWTEEHYRLWCTNVPSGDGVKITGHIELQTNFQLWSISIDVGRTFRVTEHAKKLDDAIHVAELRINEIEGSLLLLRGIK